jgi:hypothetical protein
MTSRKRLRIAVLLVVAVLAPGGVSATPHSPRPTPATRTSVEVAGDRARGWDAVEQALGVDLAKRAAQLGGDRLSLEELPALPWAVTHAITSLAAGGDLAESSATAAADATERAVLSTELAPDVTGDGIDDLWLVNSLTGRPDVASLVDAATGRELWRRHGKWSAIAPVLVGDVDGDGVGDLAATITEFLTITQRDDFEGEDRESSLQVDYRSGVAVLSGATGQRIWESVDEESFGLAVYSRYAAIEHVSGVRIWLDNMLLAPEFLPRPEGGQLVVQRVDQDGRTETGGRGAYVWSQDPAFDGVKAVDTARQVFGGATRARLVDPVDGTTRRELTTPAGEGIGFVLSSQAPAQPYPDMLWVTLTLPEQQMQCVEVACLQEAAANRSMAVEAYAPDGTLRWQRGWSGRYVTGLHTGEDLNADGAGDVLLEEIVRAGDSYQMQLASVDGTRGSEVWRTSLGATAGEVFAMIGAVGRPVIVVYEVTESDGQLSLTLRRVNGRNGEPGPISVHDVEFIPAPDDPLGLFGEPYVASAFSQVWLDVGGDSNGDGTQELLISLSQQRTWSDGRPPTYWGRWAVESGAAGAALHGLHHTDQPRIVAAWGDTTGDGQAEFVEYTSSPRAVIEHDGITAAQIRSMGDHLTPLADITADAATDLLAVVVDGQGGHIVGAVDGRTHAPVWTLAVPREQ